MIKEIINCYTRDTSGGDKMIAYVDHKYDILEMGKMLIGQNET